MMFLWFGAKKKKEAAKRAEEARLAEQARLEAEAKAKEKAEAEAKAKADAEAKKAAAKKAAPKASSAKKNAPKSEPKVEPKVEEKVEEKAVKGKFEIKRAGENGYMFNVWAANVQIIASSQTYTTLANCKNGIESVAKHAEIAAIEDQTLQNPTVEKCPKFELYLDRGGKYRFRLIAQNGQNILSCSQGYTTKESCKKGIKSVIANSKAPTVMAEE